VTIDLTPRLRAAANYMAEHGWTKGIERDEDDGSVCLTGAIRYCAPQNGDEYLVRAVLRRRGRAEAWNDADGRTDDEVLTYLRTAEVTDADLAHTFGPQWEAIVALVRRAARLTEGEAVALDAAWYATGYAARDAAWYATGYAARDAARDAAWRAAGAAARDAAWRAAWALAVRELIGQGGFTADHYRTLTGPWAQVIGPVHPDDERDGLYVGGDQ
jgi:hypothetical protein